MLTDNFIIKLSQNHYIYLAYGWRFMANFDNKQYFFNPCEHRYATTFEWSGGYIAFANSVQG